MTQVGMFEKRNSGPLLSIELRPVSKSESESWKLEGVCATVDPELFFPDRDSSAEYNPALAKRICASCPVIAQCLEYALKHNEQHGIWGGASVVERRAMRRARGMTRERLCGTEKMPNSA